MRGVVLIKFYGKIKFCHRVRLRKSTSNNLKLISDGTNQKKIQLVEVRAA